VTVFTAIAIVGLAAPAVARASCPDVLRLRNAATEIWRQAMRVPRSERCAALHRAAAATAATLDYASDNRTSCDIADPLLSEVERYHRDAVQARDNVCAGRLLRPYPPDIIQH
jgi:hypothetical protein